MTLEFLNERNIPFEEDVSLSDKSWIKTGGKVALWITPKSVSQLEEICRYLFTNSIAFDLVGQTSNIFFHNTYNPLVVVSTTKVANYEIKDDIIECDCGVNVMKLAKDCLSQGYAGFYGLVGLPGTVASAAVNNAGCFGCSISSMLISADVLMPDGTIKTFSKEDFGYEKRSSRFKRGELKGVILSMNLKLQKAENIEEELRKSDKTKLYRKNYQEGTAKNLGSVFSNMKQKRNLKNLAAVLISSIAGIKGASVKRLVNKRILLFLYGYRDLTDYISDKQINTFVWHDSKADQKFVRYKEFMAKVYKNLTIEIEERL